MDLYVWFEIIIKVPRSLIHYAQFLKIYISMIYIFDFVKYLYIQTIEFNKNYLIDILRC